VEGEAPRVTEGVTDVVIEVVIDGVTEGVTDGVTGGLTDGDGEQIKGHSSVYNQSGLS